MLIRRRKGDGLNRFMLIVAITGMPGAGKSTAAAALEQMKFKRIVMGDVIREETRRRGLTPDEKNTGVVMKELREKRGPGAVAELCLATIRAAEEDTVVVDGIRSMVEVEMFRKAGTVLLLAILASRRRRFELLRARARSDDPLTFDSFNIRDERELSIGIGIAIALADEVIPNEHIESHELAKKAVSIVGEWMKSIGKLPPG